MSVIFFILLFYIFFFAFWQSFYKRNFSEIFVKFPQLTLYYSRSRFIVYIYYLFICTFVYFVLFTLSKQTEIILN